MMKQISKQLVLIIALLLVGGVSLSAVAQKAAKNKAAKKTAQAARFLGMGDGIEFCAVTGEKLENKDIKGEFFGRTVYFCCAGCLAKAQKTPARYVKKTEAEQLEAVKGMVAKEAHHHADHPTTEAAQPGATFLGKGDGIETCPVTGEPISKDVTVEVQGKTVYACCPGCLGKIKDHPEQYLKWATKQ